MIDAVPPSGRDEGSQAGGDCLDYAPYWCEENVARFLSRSEFLETDSRALLISNLSRSVAMLAQRAGTGRDGFVSWDYHVVALVRDGNSREFALFDFDTTLGFPVRAGDWIFDSFPREIESRFRPLFRLLPGREYVESLASDRSHMRKPDGSWAAPPPPWPPFGMGRSNNLADLLDMSRGLPGVVLDRPGLEAFCAARS